MSYPILGICGPAGSGKDAIAAIAAKALNGTCIAQADPMKRLAGILFGFTAEQCWGPSACRNAPDPRYTRKKLQEALELEARGKQYQAIDSEHQQVKEWLVDVVGRPASETVDGLRSWYRSVLEECLKRDELTPRLVLQSLGTQWGREQDKNIWVDYAMRMAEGVLQGRPYNNQVGLDSKFRVGGPDYVIVTDVRFRNEVLAIKAKGGQVWRVFDPNATKDVEVSGGIKGHASETEMKSIPGSYFDHSISNDKTAGLAALEEALLDGGPVSDLRSGPHITYVRDFSEEK
jgi:hypothetical protein